jgi:hypothetical protein
VGLDDSGQPVSDWDYLNRWGWSYSDPGKPCSQA